MLRVKMKECCALKIATKFQWRLLGIKTFVQGCEHQSTWRHKMSSISYNAKHQAAHELRAALEHAREAVATSPYLCGRGARSHKRFSTIAKIFSLWPNWVLTLDPKRVHNRIVSGAAPRRPQVATLLGASSRQTLRYNTHLPERNRRQWCYKIS